MVVEPLGHELEGERIALPARLLDLGALVLEPDFDLGLVELQLCCQVLSAFLGQVPVLLELLFEPRQLVGRERRPGSLLVRLLFFLFHPSGPGT